MLPEIRSQEHLFSIPKFSVSNGDVKKFISELKGFMKSLAIVFTEVNPEAIFFGIWSANSVS